MPSLRELMAAKKAGAAKTAAPADSGAPKKPEGLKIRDTDAPPPGECEPLPATTVEAEGRQLQRAQADGDQIPEDYPCANASGAEKLWWQARHSMHSDLVIWIEPDSDHAWIAVAPPDKRVAPLVLLHRLPLATNPRAVDPY